MAESSKTIIDSQTEPPLWCDIPRTISTEQWYKNDWFLPFRGTEKECNPMREREKK